MLCSIKRRWDVNDADQFVCIDTHLYTPVTSMEVTIQKRRIINPPPFMTQKSLHNLYPTDLVSIQIHKDANK